MTMTLNTALQTVGSVEPAYLAGAIGMTAGVLGVTVAIYLQLLAESYCPPIYIAEFFVAGSALILLNVGIVNNQLQVLGNWLPVIGNTVLLLAELYGIRYVVNKVSISTDLADVAATPDER